MILVTTLLDSFILTHSIRLYGFNIKKFFYITLIRIFIRHINFKYFNFTVSKVWSVNTCTCSLKKEGDIYKKFAENKIKNKTFSAFHFINNAIRYIEKKL